MNSELDKLARSRGYGSLSDLAKAMDRTPTLFFNNLAYFAKNPSYKSKFAKDLLRTLDMTGEEFRAEMEALKTDKAKPERGPLLQKIFDRKAIAFANMEAHQHEELVALIDSLDENDTYTYVSAEKPLEISSPAFQDAIIRAVLAGVSFRYVFTCPFSASQNSVSRTLLGPTDGKGPGKPELPGLHKNFTGDLNARYLLLHKKAAPKNFFPDIIRFIDGTRVNISPIHSYIIISKGISVYVLEKVKTGKSYSTLNEATVSVWHPLPSPEATYVAGLVESVKG